MFEGVSGAYIEPIVAANDWGPFGISMPELSRIARENVVFTNFITQQRQTNRGEYALLCGELPRLFSAEAKMTELAARSDKLNGKRCLPAALAEAGYATIYLQSARTTFMLKDKFMPSARFRALDRRGVFRRRLLAQQVGCGRSGLLATEPAHDRGVARRRAPLVPHASHGRAPIIQRTFPRRL